jgi:hypothetical protein
LCLASTALIFTLVHAQSAQAQTAPDATTAPTVKKPASDDKDLIIVTGTRVSQKVADQPITTISLTAS